MERSTHALLARDYGAASGGLEPLQPVEGIVVTKSDAIAVLGICSIGTGVKSRSTSKDFDSSRWENRLSSANMVQDRVSSSTYSEGVWRWQCSSDGPSTTDRIVSIYAALPCLAQIESERDE